MGPFKSILWRKTGSSVLPIPDHYYIVFFGKQFLHFKEGQPDFKDAQCVLRIHDDILKQNMFQSIPFQYNVNTKKGCNPIFALFSDMSLYLGNAFDWF